MLKPITGMRDFTEENSQYRAELKTQIAKEDAAYALRKSADAAKPASPSKIISDGAFRADHEWVDGRWMEV